MAEDPRYGNFDGLASRFAPGEAWVLNTDRTKWTEFNSTKHAEEVHEMSKAKWEERFPDAPPLPPEAFKASRG